MVERYDAAAVETRWLARWEEAGLNAVARPADLGKPKFLIHFAYPGISGYLHVGHMRGFSYADAFARYKRMTGHRVLYPAGFHASGIPSVGLARRVERGDEATLDYLRQNGTPEDVIPTLATPAGVVQYFSEVYAKDYWKRFGFTIDWTTLCTTIDPGYSRFIQWQFRRLDQHGLLVQKPHYGPFCPVDGAVAVDPSESDISQGGMAEVKEFTNVVFRTTDGVGLPCATLRPETTYAVTNLWVNPGGRYVRIRVGDGQWIVAEDSLGKVRAQRDDVAEGTGQPFAAQDLLAMSVINPLTEKPVPVLPGIFVDPAIGTGLVMSVPAHAPYDWRALADLGMPVKPLVMIHTEGVTGVPAEQACARHGVKSQADKDALDAATEELYRDEFNKGLLTEVCGDFAGRRVREAKDEIRERLEAADPGGRTFEFSQRVVCRCGQDVVIRRIPAQWFIRYSDASLTAAAKKHAATMRIFPEEYQRDLPNVLDWFADRACVRRGSWLGTSFPFDEEWIIEPISDSTLYPAYYIISPYINDDTLSPDDLTDAFFDYVFLGQGAALSDSWDAVRRDFEAWYPVDMNLGGKEHKTVHFPPYVMNHVALLGPKLSPRGIFVNWWVTQKAGEKISKSKGGAEPIPGAAAKYSVDGMRLYYANAASAHIDMEWDADLAMNYRNRVARVHELVSTLLGAPETADDMIDQWLEQQWASRLSRATAALQAFDLRSATTELYFEFVNDLAWHRRRGGSNSPAVRDIVGQWIRALAPVTPFVAEQLWSAFGGQGLVSLASYPRATRVDEHGPLRVHEEFAQRLIDDLATVRRVSGIDKPNRVILYTAPSWKIAAAKRVDDAVASGGRDVGGIIRSILVDSPEVPKRDVAPFVQRQLKSALASSHGAPAAPLDERVILDSLKQFVSRELAGATVMVYEGDDDAAPDPGKKRGSGIPGKPAIYVE